MIIFFAGCDDDYKAELLQQNRILSSYYNIEPYSVVKYATVYKPKEYFMDCGAFSAWQKGTTIDIHQYCQFLMKHKKYLTYYAHLDVKGDDKATMHNLHIMEKVYGLNPLPVWHLSIEPDNLRLLELMLERYEYIAIGAMAGESTKQEDTLKALNKVFDMVIKKYLINGVLTRKLHAFGSTGRALLDYPWYSADSTSWLAGMKFGALAFFDKEKGSVRTIPYRDEKLVMKNFHKLSPKLRDLYKISDLKADKVNNNMNRLRIAIQAYLDMEEHVTKVWESRGIRFIHNGKVFADNSTVIPAMTGPVKVVRPRPKPIEKKVAPLKRVAVKKPEEIKEEPPKVKLNYKEVLGIIEENLKERLGNGNDRDKKKLDLCRGYIKQILSVLK